MEMHMQPQYLRELFDAKYITDTKSFLGGITLTVYDSRQTFLFDVTIRIGNDWIVQDFAGSVLGRNMAAGNGTTKFVAFLQKKRMLAKCVEIVEG